MGPVFLFGTGRCGSTHLQRLISLNTEVWVWGEHDGFLNPLLRTLKNYENSAALQRAVFDVTLPDSDAGLVERVRNEAAILSWLNRLDRGSLRRELRLTIARLFAHGVPEGWKGWGFKEILYGGPDDVPAILLDMFPYSRAAFTFRDPASTIDSMIRSWTPNIARDPARLAELAPMYDGRAKRWCEVMGYFIALKQAQPARLAMLDLESINLPPRQVLRLMRLPPRTDAAFAPLPPTNRGPRTVSDAAAAIMAGRFEHWRERMQPLYEIALTLRP